jgi:hypothetical protein
MPLNEASRRPRREHYPLEFDLTGVPRDKATRDRLLQQRKEHQEMTANSFLIDKLSDHDRATLLDQLLQAAPVGREIDLSKPVTPRYQYKELPRLVYHHDTGAVLQVNDPAQLKAALKRGYQLEASPKHDYSKLSGANIAPLKADGPAREQALSADELAALDAADEEK